MGKGLEIAGASQGRLLDAGMLGEAVRRTIGYGHPNELVIITGEGDAE